MKRAITAILLIAAATYLVFWAPNWLFLVAACCMGLLCYWEYSGLVSAHGIPRSRSFGILAGVLILVWPEEALTTLTLLAALALTTALRHADLRGVLPQVSSAFFGVLYAFAPWRYATLLRSESTHWLFFGLALNWAGDTATLYVGRTLGKPTGARSESQEKLGGCRGLGPGLHRFWNSLHGVLRTTGATVAYRGNRYRGKYHGTIRRSSPIGNRARRQSRIVDTCCRDTEECWIGSIAACSLCRLCICFPF